jgi:type I restriction enzyme S subunit
MNVATVPSQVVLDRCRTPSQTYSVYRDTHIDWLGKVPEHWTLARLREHVTLVNGFPFDSSLFGRTDGVPLIRIRDILSVETEVRWTGVDVPAAAVGNGDILVGMDGDFNVACWNGGAALLNQRVCCLRSRRSLDQQFLFYFLPVPLQVVNDLTYSTTVKHLSSFDVLRLRFALPPLQEQRAITAFLDRETVRIDTLIGGLPTNASGPGVLTRLVTLLHEYRSALISAAVTGKIDVRTHSEGKTQRSTT